MLFNNACDGKGFQKDLFEALRRVLSCKSASKSLEPVFNSSQDRPFQTERRKDSGVDVVIFLLGVLH